MSHPTQIALAHLPLQTSRERACREGRERDRQRNRDRGRVRDQDRDSDFLI